MPYPCQNSAIDHSWRDVFAHDCYTQSIVPALAIHIAGLFMFFVFVWPADRTRPLIRDVGTNASLWTHVAQALIFSALAAWTFRRLYLATRRSRGKCFES
jgi:hypothetical protein